MLVGESVIDAADVLVAIWDGEEGRGPGGTAHVVELALQRMVPVIHIDIDRGSDEVRMRAIVGGDATIPLDESLHDYSGLLRDALKLGTRSSESALTSFDP